MRVYDTNLLIYSFKSDYSFLQADLLRSDVYKCARCLLVIPLLRLPHLLMILIFILITSLISNGLGD